MIKYITSINTNKISTTIAKKFVKPLTILLVSVVKFLIISDEFTSKKKL